MTPTFHSVGPPVYRAFGLNIASEIPFLDMTPVNGIPDVVVVFGRIPEHIPEAKISGVRFEAGPGVFLLRVDGVAGYYVTGGKSIVVERKSGAIDEEVLLFLMGSAMGALLHQRNILPLHAGAVRVDGGAVLFVGSSGIGKSTLVAGFQKQSYPVVADDVCAVTGNAHDHPTAVPGFPRLKLWTDVLGRLERRSEGLRRVRQCDDLEKYFVPLDHEDVPPAPVRSVFELQSTSRDQFEIDELSGMERIKPLLSHTYRPRFLAALGDKQVHFRQCSAVAAAVPVFKVRRPRQGFRLLELMELIEGHW